MTKKRLPPVFGSSFNDFKNKRAEQQLADEIRDMKYSASVGNHPKPGCEKDKDGEK